MLLEILSSFAVRAFFCKGRFKSFKNVSTKSDARLTELTWQQNWFANIQDEKYGNRVKVLDAFIGNYSTIWEQTEVETMSK